MLNILINAYAVSPNWGSEPGLGWNWIINLAKYCNVFVITEGEWKNEIEIALMNLPQRDNLHFYYNPVSSEVRKMCWNQGDWRFYRFYRKWQRDTLKIAQDIIKDNKIDVIHQLNMIGFREPGSLWKIKDIPFVWGPVGGYGWTTLGYLDGQPIGVKCKAVIKNIINDIQGRFYPLSNKAMRKARIVLAANSNVFHYVKRHKRNDVVLMNETGCNVIDNKWLKEDSNLKYESRKAYGHFDILWVGKFDYRKQLTLAINSICLLVRKYPFVRLNIVGEIDTPAYRKNKKLVESLGIEKNIVWHGRIPNKQVHEMMRKSDIFFFTSIDEGTPHVVLEALQNNLPVICFDTCGQGDVIDDKVGIKIPLTNSRNSPQDFADTLSTVIENPDILAKMRENCSVRQEELSWDNKIREVVSMYNDIVKNESK